ncbi:VanZ family protein [Streptomyces sp. NPDC058700]|uniref:VanZ family protein n=1 Tax=unclassified Streptomyces TaxID=2593676 RepID=UPI003647B73B
MKLWRGSRVSEEAAAGPVYEDEKGGRTDSGRRAGNGAARGELTKDPGAEAHHAGRGTPPEVAPEGTGEETPRRGPNRVVRVLVALVALVGMVGFAIVLAGLTLNESPASVSLTHSNLTPGRSIRAYLEQPGFVETVKQLGGNVALGVPFGILLPLLSRRTRGMVRVGLLTVGTMLIVELIQGALITGRAFDIDDVVLNTAGALLGYLVVGRRMGRAVHPRTRPRWWTRRATGSAG